jgi:hydroxymethylpyrimidine pyrophosphatase-like HAD family hydrolase
VPKLISFDIDGTLETGDPPGYITMARVRKALELGYIVGSCSDRPVSHQQRMWMEHDICVAFTVLKHQLDRVKAEFSAEQYYHIGDTNMDRHYAERAGFSFFYPDASVDHLWIPTQS